MISNLIFIFFDFFLILGEENVKKFKESNKNLMFSLNKENVGTGVQSLNFYKIF